MARRMRRMVVAVVTTAFLALGGVAVPGGSAIAASQAKPCASTAVKCKWEYRLSCTIYEGCKWKKVRVCTVPKPPAKHCQPWDLACRMGIMR